MATDTRSLIERCIAACERGGDDSAWEEFVDRFEGALRHGVGSVLPRRTTGTPLVADDVLQEIYCRLLERGGRRLARCRERSEPAVRAYLMRMARNVAIDCLRAGRTVRRGRRHLAPRAPADLLAERTADRRPSIEERLILRQEGRRFLRRCRRVAAGPAEDRNARILALAFLGGLTSREISSRLDRVLTPGSIDSLISRARRKLAADGWILATRRRGAGRGRRRRG